MYENTVFLINGNEELAAWAIVLLMYPAFKLLTYSKRPKIALYGEKKAMEYSYSIQHRTFI